MFKIFEETITLVPGSQTTLYIDNSARGNYLAVNLIGAFSEYTAELAALGGMHEDAHSFVLPGLIVNYPSTPTHPSPIAFEQSDDPLIPFVGELGTADCAGGTASVIFIGVEAWPEIIVKLPQSRSAEDQANAIVTLGIA